MRGLRLFIRPIEPGDRGAIDAFLKSSSRQVVESSSKSSGRQVGESSRGKSSSRQVVESSSTPARSGEDHGSRELDDLTTRRLDDLSQATRRLDDLVGLVAKLLGDIVAVAFVEEERDVLRVRLLLVAETFRKKWIGRAMLGELEQLARKLDKQSLVVDNGDAAGAEEFLRRTGFHGEGERWVRVVP